MNISWNAKEYQKDFSFVPAYGEGVVGLLGDIHGRRVLDVGCGNGLLTKKLCEQGAIVTGADASETMLALARENCPEAAYLCVDATRLTVDEPFDAVFSNAVFHWIDDEKQDALLSRVRAALKSGGVLACEFGGFGCAATVHAALGHALEKRGRAYQVAFYFPTIGQYVPRMEAHGLRLTDAQLFDRFTPQGEKGLRGWIEMFVPGALNGFDADAREAILREVEDECREKLLVDGVWHVDYVRIRLRAKAV